MKISRRSIVKTILPGAILATALTGRAKAQGQPRMEEALESLRNARRQLQEATRDKGGHREKAIRYINQAISEVERGIRYDRRR